MNQLQAERIERIERNISTMVEKYDLLVEKYEQLHPHAQPDPKLQQQADQDSYLEIAIQNFLIDRRVQNLSRKTVAYYYWVLRKFIQYCNGRSIKTIDELTPDVIRKYIFSLTEAGHNAGGVHAHFRGLRAFLNWFENEYEPEGWKNPIKKVKAPRVPQEPLDPISDADFQALLDTCDRSMHGARDRAILMTLFDSGVRAGELAALSLDDIDLVTGYVLVRQGKGRKPRTTFVGEMTRKAIRAWLEFRGDEPGPLFLSEMTNEMLTYSGLKLIMLRRSKAAGVEKPGLHDFRRAFCLSQLQAGTSELAIARMMGHTTTELIARYAKQSGANLRELYQSPVDKDRR